VKATKLKFHGPQAEYFAAGPQPTLFLGGVGSGKTFIGILKLLYLLEQYPGSRGVIIRQRFAQLKKTTAATLRQLLPRQQIARRNDNEGYIQLKNGSELLLMHLDKPDSIDNLKSLELNFAYIDQMEDIREEAWDTLLERIGRWTGATMKGGFPKDWPYRTREGDSIPPAYAFVSAYSPGYDHWITKRWWEKGSERDKYRKQGYIVVIGSTRENPNLTKSYVDGRLAMGEEYVERFVDALSWGANEGRIFQVDDQSYVQPTADLLSKIKGEMHLHRVLDPGDYTTTACLWYATDRDGNVFFYREYGKENELVSAHRRNIFELSKLDSFNGKDLPMYHSNIADPIISNKTRGRSLDKAPQWSVQDEYTDRAIMEPETAVYWRKANNDESMTISRVREYLRVDPHHRNPITGLMGAPRIYFVLKTPAYPNGLHETITDMIAAKREECGENADGTKQFRDKRDEDVRDHYLDCVRYAIGMRPKLAPPKAGPATPDGTIRLDEYYKLSKDYRDFEKRQERAEFKGHSDWGQ
jgi:phage terminase large subunit